MSKMIVLAGNVGAGKSTFTEMLSKELNFSPYYESVSDNPFLKDFYVDQKRWSYHLQTYFLFHRFKNIKKILENSDNAVLDRSIYEDAEIFAKNLFNSGKMSESEYFSYRQIFYTMLDFIKKPDLLIYIETNIDTVMERIKKRGRDMEIQTPRNYWKSLDDLYSQWIENYDYSEVYKINGNETDIVKYPQQIKKITYDIKNILKI